jgi:hypothetical protein
MSTVAELINKMNTTPEFAKLSYDEQVQLRAQLLPDALKTDSNFLSLDPTTRSALFQDIVIGQAPRLEDPIRQKQMEDLITAAKGSDPQAAMTAKKQIEAIASNQAFAANSLLAGSLGAGLGWLAEQATKVAAPLYPQELRDQMMKSLPAAQASAENFSNPRDTVKMSDYFQSQLDPNSGEYRRIQAVKTAAPIIGNLLDWSVIGAVTGGTGGVGTGLGKLAMKAAVGAAERATTMSGRFAWTLGKQASHAALTASIGTAREFALDTIKKGEVDPNIQNLLVNNAKNFAGYFLGDAIFNFALDTVLPVVKSMSQIYYPKGQIKEGLKGLTDIEMQNHLLDILGGRELAPTLVAQFDRNGSYRAMQAAVKVSQNVTAATDEQLLSTVLSHHNLNLTPLEGGAYRVNLAGLDSLLGAPIEVLNAYHAMGKIRFENLDTVKRWFMQRMETGVTTPLGYEVSKVPGAMFKYKSFAEQDMGLEALAQDHIVTNKGLKMWQEEVDNFIPFLTPEQQQANLRWIYQEYNNPEALQGAAGAMAQNAGVQKNLQALLTEMGIKDKVVVYRGGFPSEDPGKWKGFTNGSFSLDEASNFKKPFDAYWDAVKGDITIAPTKKEWAKYNRQSKPGSVFAYLVPKEDIVGFGAQSEFEVYWRTANAEYLGNTLDPNLRKIHAALIEDAYSKGQMIPQEVAMEYPQLLPPWRRPLTEMEPAAGAYKAELNQVIKGKINNPASVDTLVRLYAPDESGVYKPSQLQAFVQHTGSLMGMKKAELDSLKIVTVPTTGEVYGEQIVFQTPKDRFVLKSSPRASAEVENLTRIMSMIEEAAGGSQIKGLTKKVVGGYGQSILNQKLFTPQWADLAAKDLNLELKQLNPREWVLTDVNGGVTFRGPYQDAKLELVRQAVDPEYLKAYLSREGFTLRQTKEMEYQVFAPGSAEPIARGATVQDVLRDAPQLLPKIPSRLGPDLAVVVPGKRVDVVYQKNLAVGSYPNLMQALDSYSNEATINGKVSLHVGKSGYVYANRLNKQLEVYIPEVGYRKYFDKVADAKAYMEGGWQSAEEIQRIANVKGYFVKPMGGKYLLWSNGISIKAENIDQLKAILRDVPVPEWAPELSGLTEESLKGLPQFGDGAFQPVSFIDNSKTPGKWSVLSQFWQDPIFWFEGWVKKGGDENILKAIHQLEVTRKAVIGADHEAAQWLIAAHSPGGKMLSDDRLEILGEYLNAKGTEKQDLAAVMSGEELKVADQMRQFYDGLKLKYGVDPIMFKEVYFPHISRFVMSKPAKKMYGEGDTAVLLQDVFGPNPPAELDAFFKHWRVSDVLGVAMERNSLKAAMKYVAVGNRQTIQGEAWKNAMEVLGTTTDDIGKRRFLTYLNDVKGLPQGNAAIVVKQAALEDLKKLGLEGGPATHLLDTIMSMGYTAALGFSPWKSVRNALDIYVTVAPRLGWDGNEWLAKAARDIHADREGIIFNRYKASGDITAAQRVAGGEDFMTEGKLGKVLKSGMAWYKNSDELTRAIAYHATELKFENALRVYTAGLEGKGKIMTEDAFEEMSGFCTLSPTKANEIRGYIRKQQWGVAKAAYASQIVDETLFPYRGGLTPLAFRGVVGKLFGMMGHYPVYYIENIRRAIQYGTPATKIAFAGLFLANSAALYGTMKLMGTTGQDYVPWNPAAFTGGPYYQMMNTALMTLGRGYQGRQARAELFGMQNDATSPVGFKIDITKSNFARWFIPGGFQLLKMQKGLDYWNQGDHWSAFLSMLGTTPDPLGENLWNGGEVADVGAVR